MRYAIYWAPASGSALWRAGSRWLGRDAAGGSATPWPDVPGLAPGRFAELTREAARYGFHATLKAPFELAAGLGEQDLLGAVRRLADRCAAFHVEAAPACLAGFPALRPLAVADEARLADLAGLAVRELHPLAATLSAADLNRRPGLTARERERLETWGYPWVFDDYRFHVTLAALPASDREREAVLAAARAWFGAPLGLDIDALSVFRETLRGAPFERIARFALGGGHA
ncbi:DUF1045 domain-containing protein [Paludibacterium paludis]|uniref:Phosphonate metabolism protein n=1 Tax=Paludibacterium paludis TaxID=1225769 RepID=A0A918NY09_9NEIS|nr:DUF1045 domain-containing protein [Paludibacterium paludis]GGY04096.1 hypothetical protein GCM10011289_03110 [Paludibacterium paludis]